MALKGQTWHENANNISDYNMGAMFNLKQALGRRYVAAILNPFAQSDLYSDGSSFARRNQVANNNSLELPTSSTFSPFNVPKRRII